MLQQCEASKYQNDLLQNAPADPDSAPDMQRSFEVRMSGDVEKRLRHAAEKRNAGVEELLHQLITAFLNSEERSELPSNSDVEIRPSSSRDPDGGGGKEPLYTDLSEEEFRDLLSPEMQRLYNELGQPAPNLELDADTRAWIDVAAEKHQ